MYLPVIIGCGGINAAGRSSFNQAFNWINQKNLSKKDLNETLLSILLLTNQIKYSSGNYIHKDKKIELSNLADYLPKALANSLIRKINLPIDGQFNFNLPIKLKGKIDVLLQGNLSGVDLPANSIRDNLRSKGTIEIDENNKLYLGANKRLSVNAGGQLPTGFNPGGLYNSANHPRGLQMALFAISDCLLSTGLTWNQLTKNLKSDKIGIYATSMLGQLDGFGAGGYLQARLKGKRVKGKQLPLSMPQMVADFINAYVLNNIGYTHAAIGACATFLYNLNSAVSDIQSGKRRLAVVGCADAPLFLEMIESYESMGALVTDKQLMQLDNLKKELDIDFSRACRPFAINKGFVLGESAQFFVLCDDLLAIELGVNVIGSVPGVFINADGIKGSISKPGPGNIFSLAQACSLAKSIIGDNKLKHNTLLSAHGTGTPQNRVSESSVLYEITKIFGISNWPINAIKCYVGHSTGAAAGDQLTFLLGALQNGWFPSISTIDSIASDVKTKNLNFCLSDYQFDTNKTKGGFINSKGFGGNNASAFVLSPLSTIKLMEQRNGKRNMNKYYKTNKKIQTKVNENKQLMLKNESKIIFNRLEYNNQFAKIEYLKDSLKMGDYQTGLINKNPYIT